MLSLIIITGSFRFGCIWATAPLRLRCSYCKSMSLAKHLDQLVCLDVKISAPHLTSGSIFFMQIRVEYCH